MSHQKSKSKKRYQYLIHNKNLKRNKKKNTLNENIEIHMLRRYEHLFYYVVSFSFVHYILTLLKRTHASRNGWATLDL